MPLFIVEEGERDGIKAMSTVFEKKRMAFVRVIWSTHEGNNLK